MDPSKNRSYTSLLYVEPYQEYKKFLSIEKIYSDDIVLHKHHILPKSLGGTDKKENIISLSVVDHAHAHYLLSKCFDEGAYESSSNLMAARVISKKSIRDVNVLKRIGNAYKGKNNPFYGKTHTEETKRKIGLSCAKYKKNKSYEEIYEDRSYDEKRKRKEASEKIWKLRSNEEKELLSRKISEAIRNRPEIENINRARHAANRKRGYYLVINGTRYESFTEASKDIGMTVWFIRKTYNIVKVKYE